MQNNLLQQEKVKSNLTLENERLASVHIKISTEEHSASPSSFCSSQTLLSAVAAKVLR